MTWASPEGAIGDPSLDKPPHPAIRRIPLPGCARVLWRCGPGEGRIALTFDDGPHPAGTPAVLEALADLGARSTFFLVSECATRHPALVETIVAAGHEVALHGDRHERLDAIGVSRLTERLSRARRVLESLSGSPVLHYRPPFGALKWSNLRAARNAGLTVVLWSHDPWDWQPQPDAELRTRLSACLLPGAIVLLHDGSDRGARTAAALRSTFVKPLRPVTLSEL